MCACSRTCAHLCAYVRVFTQRPAEVWGPWSSQTLPGVCEVPDMGAGTQAQDSKRASSPLCNCQAIPCPWENVIPINKFDKWLRSRSYKTTQSSRVRAQPHFKDRLKDLNTYAKLKKKPYQTSTWKVIFWHHYSWGGNGTGNRQDVRNRSAWG